MSRTASKREPPLRIPLDFDQVMGDLLKVKPPMREKPRKGRAWKSTRKPQKRT
jgi:hypothetical protein